MVSGLLCRFVATEITSAMAMVPESDIGACSMWPNNSDAASSTGILQLLEGKLVLVQKDKGYMKELAKKSLLQGRKILDN